MNNKQLKNAREQLEKEIKRVIPKYELLIKENSKLMKFIGSIIFFNKEFMTRYTTTVYPKVYVTKQAFDNTWSCFATLTHEFVHLLHTKKKGTLWFSFLYSFPQILAPLALTSLLAIWFSNWWLLNLLWLVCAAPLPAYFRMKEELEAYTMTLLVSIEEYKDSFASEEALTKYQEEDILRIAENFYGPNYYYMWPFKKDITRRLKKQRARILNGYYDHQYPYKFVKDLFKKTGEV